MKRYWKYAAIELWLGVILLCGCTGTEVRSASTQIPSKATPSLDTSTLTTPEVEIVTVPFILDANQKPEKITINQDGTYRAFTVQVQIKTQSGMGDFQERIVIENLITDQAYQLQLPITWRPFSKIVWNSPTIIVFDQWTQPHYGIHYSFNMESMKLASWNTFSDEYNQRVILTVKDAEGNPESSVPVSVFESDTYITESITDGCGRVSFFLPSGKYSFQSIYNSKVFISSEGGQCKVPGCIRSNVTLSDKADLSVTLSDISEMCSRNSGASIDVFCNSHLLLSGRNNEVDNYQIWVVSMKEGSSDQLLSAIPTVIVDLAILNDQEQLLLIGNDLWLSDMTGRPLEKVEDTKSILSNLQPYSSTWNSVAQKSDVPEATDFQHGYLYSPDGENVAIWQPEDTWLIFRNVENDEDTLIYQTGPRDTIKGAWSFDGKNFAFSYSKYGMDWYSQLFIVGTDGINLHSLSPKLEYVSLGYPKWSPDGQSIAYSKSGPCSDYHHLMVSDLHNGEIKAFSVNKIRPSFTDEEEIAWSPDSNWIAFLTESPFESFTEYTVEVINIETGERILLSSPPFIPQIIDWHSNHIFP